MKCPVCNTEMIKTNVTNKSPYHYKECGLPEVYLVGIETFSCEKCGEYSVAIPKIEQLHKLIVKDLLEKPSVLTFKEVRFLRKEVGFSAKKWASNMGISPEHLSRSEKADSALSVPMDKFVRAIVTILSNDSHGKIKDILLGEAEDLKVPHKKKERFKAKFKLDRLDRNGWKFVA